MQLFWLCMHGLVLATIALSGLLIPLLLSLLEDCKQNQRWALIFSLVEGCRSSEYKFGAFSGILAEYMQSGVTRIN